MKKTSKPQPPLLDLQSPTVQDANGSRCRLPLSNLTFEFRNHQSDLAVSSGPIGKTFELQTKFCVRTHSGITSKIPREREVSKEGENRQIGVCFYTCSFDDESIDTMFRY